MYFLYFLIYLHIAIHPNIHFERKSWNFHIFFDIVIHLDEYVKYIIFGRQYPEHKSHFICLKKWECRLVHVMVRWVLKDLQKAWRWHYSLYHSCIDLLSMSSASHNKTWRFDASIYQAQVQYTVVLDRHSYRLRCPIPSRGNKALGMWHLRALPSSDHPGLLKCIRISQNYTTFCSNQKGC